MVKPVKKTIMVGIILLLFISILSSIAIADNSAPQIPDIDNLEGNTGGSSGGGSSYYTPPVATPTPAPTPVPPYRLDTPLPSKVTIDGVPVTIAGTTVSVPMGYLFTDVIRNDTFEAPIGLRDGGTGKLVITVEPAGSQTATIKAMHLIAEKTLYNNGSTITVSVDITLSGAPSGSSLSFDLLSPDSIDIGQVNAQLSAYSDRQFSRVPLVVIKAAKSGIENGADILGATLRFTVPRPADFDPEAAYYAIRENDGAYDILDATLVGSAESDPLIFEVVSPRGLSTFSVVEDATVPADRTHPAPPATTPVPSATPEPSGSGSGIVGYLVAIGAYIAGIVSGIVAIAIFLLIRSK